MPGRLQDRVAIVTGAASGIGRAIALAFAGEGAKVVCADLSEGTWRKDAPEDERRGATHERIQATGVGEAIYLQCNTTDPASVEGLVRQTVERFGRLDIMVNNAGIAPEGPDPQPIWATPLDTYHRTVDVNLHGVYYGTRAAAAHMITQAPRPPSGDRGCILNACSVYGLVAPPHASAYATTKGGVANLTRAAALDCAPHRVHVNAVAPGYVASHLSDPALADPEVRKAVMAQHPFGGIGEPQDVAKVYVFLASDDAGWMTGAVVPVDGGFTAQ